ncbi:type III secretion system stalk subunit SctO [Roseiconus lacunae]|uniref:type III secretion system stalk subunit SctO n=1 Tax=Roseiconus lacunae TaxID=2605694 RepID=UPI001E3E6353|nr:YscO family type III secretion system apparatus protein [Roseiconus lacunae]MCD0457872.1 type III secretion protein [Roseiconus lacunae]
MPPQQRYLLQDLLSVRTVRQESARRETHRCQHAVKQAEEAVAQAEVNLNEFIQFRIRREQELFNEVALQLINTPKLETMRFRVQQLRDQEIDRRAAVIDAKKVLQERTEALEEAEEQYREACRQNDKLIEHKSWWDAQQRREAEALEEKENEDFRSTSPLVTP